MLNNISTARTQVNVVFSDSPPDLSIQSCLSSTIATSRVIQAYFARKVETTKQYVEQPYVVLEKDTYSKIAAKVKRVDVADLRKNQLVPGTTVLLKIKKKTKELSFTRINHAKIGEQVCIIVQTAALRNQTIQVEVLESHNTTFIAPGVPVCLLQNDAETDILRAQVGAWSVNTAYANASQFQDFAIIEIQLCPRSAIERKHWATQIGNSTEKRAFLHLKVVADENAKIEYSCEDDHLPPVSTEQSIFLNRTNSWFELHACYCSMQIDRALFKQLFNLKDDVIFGHKIMEKHTGTYKSRIDDFLTQLQHCFSAYDITNCSRRAHFLGQIWLETDVFKSLEEYASGDAYEPDARDDAKSNGNTLAGDGPKYKGRGCMQLTWKNTYVSYQAFINNYPDYAQEDLVVNYAKVSSDLFLAVDSAGWFWKFGKLKRDGSAINFNRLADLKLVDTISTYVNGGGNGKPQRRAITRTLLQEFNADLCPNIPKQ